MIPKEIKLVKFRSLLVLLTYLCKIRLLVSLFVSRFHSIYLELDNPDSLKVVVRDPFGNTIEGTLTCRG
jgi:hypothetical protein